VPAIGALIAGRVSLGRRSRSCSSPSGAAVPARARLDRPDLAAGRRSGAADGDVDEPLGGLRHGVRRARVATGAASCAAPLERAREAALEAAAAKARFVTQLSH
jgi:hypothetical protein